MFAAFALCRLFLLSIAHTQSLKRELWQRGFNYFEEDNMGRLCFAKHYRQGALAKWPAKSTAAASGTSTGKMSRVAEKNAGKTRQRKYIDLNIPYMDIYPINNRTDMPYVELLNGPCGFETDWIYPFSSVEIYDRNYSAPAQPGLQRKKREARKIGEGGKKQAGKGSWAEEYDKNNARNNMPCLLPFFLHL